MKQYWYFGVRVKRSIPGAQGMRSTTLWAPTVFESAEAAAQAAAKAMVTRPGINFFIQGFDNKLVIQPDGTSSGFEGMPKGVQ
jgi:hypothetical protein